MRKIFGVLLFSAFYTVVFADAIRAEPPLIYHNLDQGSFFMRYQEVYADVAVFPFDRTVLFKVGGNDHDEISYNYFQEFDYDPADKFKLTELHEQNTFSIYGEEDAVFRVKCYSQMDHPQLF
ncbi:MAG: hypothetical protein LBN19_00425 [Endomicrobium sp.]|jgi:hypothetical protein|nr:hypothetical protein [Endomicrobium sp.]